LECKFSLGHWGLDVGGFVALERRLCNRRIVCVMVNENFVMDRGGTPMPSYAKRDAIE